MLKLFALDATRDFGEAVARDLGRPLDPVEERAFEDGEHKIRPLVGVRGAEAVVIQSLHGGPEESPNDKLCKLLFLLGALRDHGASRLTAVVPYLAYARKDRRTKPHDPLTLRYVAQLLEAVGLDRLLTVEAHNIAALENAFRREVVHLEISDLLLARAIAFAGAAPLVVASPDPGGVKRAQLFREALEARLDRPVGAAFMEKRRSAGVVSGEALVGEVEGATVLLVDDLIASGGTMVRAARALKSAGAAAVHAFAAHGLFTGEAVATLSDQAIDGIVVGDTVPPFRLSAAFLSERVEVVSAAPLVASALQSLLSAGHRT